MKDIIKRQRAIKGYSQGALAQMLHVSQGTVCQWEKGLTKPRIELLPKLAAVLDVPVDALIQPREDGKTA